MFYFLFMRVYDARYDQVSLRKTRYFPIFLKIEFDDVSIRCYFIFTFKRYMIQQRVSWCDVLFHNSFIRH